MDSWLWRPGSDRYETLPLERRDDGRTDGFDLITLLTWRFVRRPQTEGDPFPDPTVPEDVRLDDEVVEQWRWLIERGAPDDRPYVTRREIIDPQATQVRTLVVPWPFASNRAHGAVILKKIKWGVLIGQILTAGFTGAPDLNSAIKQIVDLFGAFDVALANLTHREAAVLTVAHSFKRPERTSRWLWRCNDLLARWSSPNNDLRMEESEFFQTLLALVQRGIEVEVPHDGQRDAPLLTGTDNPGILYERKVRIRPMILLVNW